MNHEARTMQLIDLKALLIKVVVFAYVSFVKAIIWLGVINETHEDEEESCSGCQCGNGGCS
ncbi:MAG: hypothetical protein HOE53_00360 [Candidatus Magasanikbacteria bacterium]|jgi:hypothetical protein|nr:hypothetical protein [Candidatus Magasanikbacteria bacterium]